MATETFTEKQRLAMEALEGARREGVALSHYAKSRGLAIREVYDAIACLRRQGLLPKPAKKAKSTFVAVRVAESSAPARAHSVIGSDVVCRIVYSKGTMIECTQWPPPAWMAALTAESWPALHTFGVDGHQHGCQTWRAHQPEMDGRRSKGGARDRARDEKRRPAGVAPGRSDAHRATRMKLQGSAQSKWVFQQPSGLPGPDEGFDAHWYAALKTAEFRTSSFTICATHARVIWPREGRAYLRSLTHSDIVRSRCQSATRTSRRRTR